MASASATTKRVIDTACSIGEVRPTDNSIDAAGAHMGITGKPVESRRGTATVDERHFPMKPLGLLPGKERKVQEEKSTSNS